MAKITSTATETIIGAGSNDSALVVGQDGGFNGGQLAGMRNLIINGGFNINQRVYASGAAVGANLYAHDRWKMAASADTYTFATVANKTTVTIPAGKVLRQVVEGLNLQTGTYVLSWEGTAQGKIGAGAYGASGITGSITGGTDTTIEFGPGTVSNVQLEWGTRASPFERRFLGLELQLCQRYFWKTFNQDVAPRDNGGDICSATMNNVGASSYTSTIYFPSTMRAIPTIAMYNPSAATANTARVYTAAGATSNVTLPLNNLSTNSVGFYVSAVYALAYYALAVSAEL